MRKQLQTPSFIGCAQSSYPQSEGCQQRVRASWYLVLIACCVALCGDVTLHAQHDLSLTMSISPDSVRAGDVVSLTIGLNNEGATAVTGVQVRAILPASLSFQSATPTAGSYDALTGVWNVGSIVNTTSSETLTIQATVLDGIEGIVFAQAEITAMDQADDDSTPDNGDYLEDDLATACTSVPIEICPLANDTVKLEAPPGLTNYQWFDGLTLVGTDSIFYVTAAGRYTWTADSVVSTCGVGSCCPVIVEEKCFDLALYKKLAPWQSELVDAGDTVTFRTTVVNQGDYYADSILLYDYLPSEATLSDADWQASTGNAYIWLVAGQALDAAGLAPGDSVNVDITLLLNAPLDANTSVRNNVEIAYAKTADNRLFADWDSTPDSTLGNDIYLVDNDIDGNGKQNGDEDDHDDALVVVKPFDLALWKELGSGQSATVVPGDSVTFTIHVVNQGQVAADSIWLRDYLPAALTLADANWTTSGGDAIRLLEVGDELPSGGLLPGAEVSVDITTILGAPIIGGTEIVNYAEITSAKDVFGRSQVDDDSTPDTNPNNDTYLSDNEINGNGKNGGDEDDHDGAAITVAGFDLALYKQLAPGQDATVVPGDLVTFQLIVVNQGQIPADNIELTDSIPNGMALMDVEWTLTGNLATRLLNAGDELPSGGLLPGQADTVTIMLKVPDPLPQGTRLWNWAEISSATDSDGFPVVDQDSDMDADLSNDKFLEDDYIDGNAFLGSDEDDHDGEYVMYEVFDIALRKTVDDTLPIHWGDDVAFTITIYNQGTIPMQDIEVYDWIPPGFVLSPNDYNGWLYAGTPDKVRMEVDDLIQPGDSLKIHIVLRAQANYCLEDLVNIAEVTSQENEFGVNQNGNDIDSYPDKDPINDNVVDNVIDQDGFNGGDEDDHDVQEPPVFDLALRLTTDRTLPVRIGDTVAYAIKVFNQGNIRAKNIGIKLTLPQGFSLSAADTNGWTDSGDGTLSNLLTDIVARGDSAMLMVWLEVGPTAHLGDLTVFAEIQSAQDANGNERTADDLDSTPDMDPTNDLLVDNEINDCGLADEDDHDLARVDLFDLALRKTPDTTAPAQWFEDVSFTITLYNQSPQLPAQQIELVDYIPAGFSLSPNDTNGWIDNGDGTATLVVPGPLAAGDSLSVPILLQVQKYTPAGTYFNRTEIAAAADTDGRDLTNYDYDSQPDTDPANDVEKDDVIDEQGRVPGMDEDDHDPAPVAVEIIDLALRKTTNQLDPVLYQQDVLFYITLYNQGSRALQNITVLDHVPLGFALSPNDTNGWVYDASQAQATLTLPDLLQPGDSLSVPILLRVQEGAAPYTFDNIAEVLSAFDDQGQDRTGDDVDSDWDTDPDNDNIVDDVIDQDATVGGDEDDHDIASVDVFDLALRKTTSVITPVTVGDDVTFHIEIFNQGSVPAANVSIIDHLPQGFALSPADGNGWIDNGDGTVSLTSPAVIAPQSSLVIPLVLRVQPDAQAGIFENIAEITAAQDDQGNDRTAFDVDSQYDTNPNNDAWVDNEINDDGDFDEDDHDKAFVEVEIIDLALRKITTFEDMAPVRIGDDVHFAFEVFNQGSVTLYDIQVVDYLPEGFELSPADGNGWTLVGDKAYNLIAGPLMPGESVSIGIVLRVTPQASPDNVLNGGELIAAIDGSGTSRLDDDRDSQPDEVSNNDVWIDDEIDLTPPDDEDDHDVEGVPIFDLALRKTTAQATPITVGDDVTFTLTVFNQGSLTAEQVELIDYLPQGFELSPNAIGWTAQGDSAAVALIAGPIAPGDSASIDIVLRVLPTAEAGIFYNAAEIRTAQELGGIDRTHDDLDSTPDDDSSNDNLTDDEITGNGQNGADEDDHDVAPVEVEIIDLALRKTTDHAAPVEDGDDVIFEIEVVNQGSVPMYQIGLIDHYPPGFVLSPNDANGWIDNGDGTASLTLPGPLMPGDNYTVGIVLRLPDKLVLGTLQNVAEIVHSEDAAGNDRTFDDRDSQADTDPANDAVLDNEVNELPPVDEDDHDYATVLVQGHDLALVKRLVSTGIFEQGDTLLFELTVYNQGNLPAYQIELTDYLPTGMQLVDAGWIDNGGLLTPATPIASLAPGDSVVLSLQLKIDDLFMEDTLTNVAEISYFEGDTGNQPEDIDATPDSNPDNDTVGGNDITDNSNDDEDDHDIEGISVNQRFDLALIKKLATGQPQSVEPGDTVRFTIVVYNQGTLFAYNVQIKDYLPAELIFDPALNTALMTSNPYDWAADATYTIPGPMYPGDAESVDIILIVDSQTDSTKLINKAEIMAADDDTDPNNAPPQDEDSTPDGVDDDFVGGNDFIHNENGDEDDHDYEPIMLLELPRGSIAGVVWFDCDEDGQRTADEQLLEGVPVVLNGTETDGDPVNMSTTTAADGTYIFEELLPGTYTVVFDLPDYLDQVMFTQPNLGDDATDSDADPLSGESHQVALFGDEITGVDAGIKDVAVPEIVPIDPLIDNLASGDTLIVTCGDEPTFEVQDVVATDNISPQSAITISLSASTTYADSCGADGFLTLTEWTWTATDSCGHSATFVVYVRVVDSTPPEFVDPPADITVSCDAIPYPEDVTAVDNCSDVTDILFAQETIGNPDSCLYRLKRQWKAVDACGNVSIHVQYVTIVDTTGPVITLDHPIYGPLADGDTLVVSCDQLPGFDMSSVVATDNCCDSTTVEFVEYVSNGDCLTDGYLYLLNCGWIATDCCGNESELFLTIIVQDQTAPVLVGVPADMTAQCDDVPPPPTVTATDNCDDDVIVTFGESQMGTACNQVIVRSWTATDECGNQATATQTITLTDNTAPVLVGVPDDTTVECDDIPPAATVTATDNCDGDIDVQFSEQTQAVDECSYYIIRTWTATDACGNTTMAQQKLFVIDTTPPTFVDAPADVTVSCDAVPAPADVVAIDNCDDDVSIDYFEFPQDTACMYQIKRVWTATDNCGNFSSHTQIITVKDTEGPTITPIEPELIGYQDGDTLAFECDQVLVLSDSSVVVSDNCSEVTDLVFVEQVVDGGNCPEDGYLVLMYCGWEATDACGNTSSLYFYIKVIDTTPPLVMDVPADVTVECDAIPPVGTVTVMDNCDDEVAVVFAETIEPGNCPHSYAIVRSWTATDHCGNATTATQVVTVEDTTPPVLSGVPSDVTVSCDAVPPAPTVIATDNCDSAPQLTFTETQTDGCPYTIVRSWTATDACGNVTTASQFIYAYDDTPPVFVDDPADITVECGQVPDPQDCIAIDNCTDSVAVTFVALIEPMDSCTYQIKRIWEAEDACGNTAVVDQLITVIDTQAPTISFTHPLLVGAQDGDEIFMECDEVAVLSAADAVAVDNCDEDPQVMFVESDVLTGNCPVDGFITSLECTWIAKDACGNQDSITLTITIVDTKAPEFVSVPDDVIVACDAPLPPLAQPEAIDGCSEVVYSVDSTIVTGNCPNNYQIIRTWTATDQCGNATSVQQVITVQDTQPPILPAPPADLTVDLTAGEVIPPAATLTASDGCSDNVDVLFEEATYPDDCFYVLQRTWSASDECGNYTAVTQTITVLQGLDPISVALTPDSCMAGLGAAAFVPDSYTYLWPGLVEGATRNDLLAGTYTVTVTNGVCDTVITIVIDNECQTVDCFDLLPDEEVVEASIDTTTYCLPVPFDMIGSYEVYLDGALLELADFTPCNLDTAVFYSYALLPNQGASGPYQVQWTVAGQIFEATVMTMDELAAWMSSVDASATWMHSAASFGIMGGDPQGGYGNMEVVHEPTQVPTTLQPNFVFVPLGAEFVVVGEGTHTVVLVDVDTECTDTLLLHFQLNVQPPLPDHILTTTFMAMGVNCDLAQATYCLEIPFTELSKYELVLNGQPYSGPIGGCDYQLQVSYSWSSLPGQGQEGPYELSEWSVNGQIFQAVVPDMQALVDLMNQWDPSGQWVLQSATMSIVGGSTGNVYSPMTIIQISTGAEAVLELSTINLPQATRIHFNPGINRLIVRRLADGLTDTLTVAVACTTPEYLQTVTYVGRVDTICLDTSQLMSTLVSISNMCEDQSDFSAEFEWLEGSNCVVCTGVVSGEDEACLIMCDDYGICDTVYLSVEIRAESQQPPVTVSDTFTTVRNLPVTVSVLDNDLRASSANVFRIVTQPDHGTVMANEDSTVTYVPDPDYCNEEEFDLFVYQLCNDYGCDATAVYIQVLCEEVVIYTGFSPNGDGVNDYFRIEGLERFQTRRLSIFNRWGTLVYFNDHYDNSWTGQWQGKDLPDGTYFYLLELDGGRMLSGYLHINR